MERRGLEIDIDLAESYRNLGAGPHTVSYIAFSDGTLWCVDQGGEAHALKCSAFRFVKVSWFDTRVSESGRVSIKLGEVWIDLGPMFADPRGRGQVALASEAKDEMALGVLDPFVWPGVDGMM